MEMEPHEMEALINKDREAWERRAKVLHDASLGVLHAIDGKDAKALIEAGGTLDIACESCHLQYWYPNAPRLPRELDAATQ